MRVTPLYNVDSVDEFVVSSGFIMSSVKVISIV
jgi:hypothetical protein